MRTLLLSGACQFKDLHFVFDHAWRQTLGDLARTLEYRQTHEPKHHFLDLLEKAGYPKELVK